MTEIKDGGSFEFTASGGCFLPLDDPSLTTFDNQIALMKKSIGFLIQRKVYEGFLVCGETKYEIKIDRDANEKQRVYMIATVPMKNENDFIPKLFVSDERTKLIAEFWNKAKDMDHLCDEYVRMRKQIKCLQDDIKKGISSLSGN